MLVWRPDGLEAWHCLTTCKRPVRTGWTEPAPLDRVTVALGAAAGQRRIGAGSWRRRRWGDAFRTGHGPGGRRGAGPADLWVARGGVWGGSAGRPRNCGH